MWLVLWYHVFSLCSVRTWTYSYSKMYVKLLWSGTMSSVYNIRFVQVEPKWPQRVQAFYHQARAGNENREDLVQKIRFLSWDSLGNPHLLWVTGTIGPSPPSPHLATLRSPVSVRLCERRGRCIVPLESFDLGDALPHLMSFYRIV